jgi:hypothetical protein
MDIIPTHQPVDGTYSALQSGWEFSYRAQSTVDGEPRMFTGKTVHTGMRGINLKCAVTVRNGVATSSLDHDPVASLLNVRAGTYPARQSGWAVNFTAPHAVTGAALDVCFHTVHCGVKGLNIPCTVTVTGGDTFTSSLDHNPNEPKR